MYKKYYAGIGSRVLPMPIINLIKEIGYKMALKGYILRSGAADGSDSDFEYGCIHACGEADIFLPWRGFKNRVKGKFKGINYIDPIQGQMSVSRRLMIDTGIIPHWDKMNETSQKFHSRNVNQVEGDFDEPDVTVVIFYAPTDWATDEVQGGTRTAVELARKKGIPTYNLYVESEKSRIMEILEINEDDHEWKHRWEV